MLQCSECEFCQRQPSGEYRLVCDPFVNIKEPECLHKWQLIKLAEHGRKLDRLVSAYEATVAMYRRLAPLQERMFRHMERELDEADDADSWKFSAGDDEDDAVDEGDDEGESPSGSR